MKISEISCAKCKKKVPTSNVKASKDGKTWICIECYNRERNVASKVTGTTIKTVTYVCGNCKYKFKGKEGYRGKCPYCSSGSVDKGFLIDDIIRDVDEVVDRTGMKSGGRIGTVIGKRRY